MVPHCLKGTFDKVKNNLSSTTVQAGLLYLALAIIAAIGSTYFLSCAPNLIEIPAYAFGVSLALGAFALTAFSIYKLFQSIREIET